MGWHGRSAVPTRRALRQGWQTRAQTRLDALGPLTGATTLASADGLEHRRPRWLDDATLVAYVQGYATRPGFYRIDAQTGRRTPISHQAVTEDYYFSLGPYTSALHFARYVPDPLVLIQARADAFRLDARTGEAVRQTTDARLLAPVPAPGGGLWALRNDGPFNQWVHAGADGAVRPMTDFARGRFQLLAPSPTDAETVAVLLNVRGRQGLFRATVEEGAVTAFAPWLVFEDASIYDASWGPDGRHLLFAADLGGVSNAYAYDTQQDRLLKLTNEPFGALEPNLSPDGTALAFVSYHHERWDLMRMPFAPDAAEVVPRALAAYGDALPWGAMLGTRYDEEALAAGEGASETVPPAARPYRS